MKQVGRRDFLKLMGGAAGVSLLAQYGRLALSKQDVEAADERLKEGGKKKTAPARAVDGFETVVDSSKKVGLVIDVGACIGCRTCMYACKEENNIPHSISPPWIEVFQLDNHVELNGHPSMEELKAGTTTSYTESPIEGKWYMPVQCNHCDNPPCVKVCPVGATFKDKDGYVLMDYDRCIGCRFCVVACPYSARRFNWSTPSLDGVANPKVPVRPVGVAEKCTFCVHRTRVGKLPRCVEVCPVGARHFGNLKDPHSEVSKLLEENRSVRLLEELGTKPNISYITRGKKYLR